MKTLRKIFKAGLWIFLLLFILAFGYYFAVTAKTKLSHEKLLLADQKIVLYDFYGEQIKNVSTATLKQPVELAEVPQKTRLAFVNVEDKRFYSHNGFDFKRILKAALNNVKSRSFKEGASTISQQLIKNTHLSQEKTINRKLKEWKLTRMLEKSYSKNEILEKYLSVIYFGHNCFGLRSAARFYFDKELAELDLADSAILAGLVKSPNNYSPFKNADKCQKRKESVLNIMLQNGSITRDERNEALVKPLPVSPTVQERDMGYLHFAFDELTALAETQDFDIGGEVEIYTYLQPDLQADLQEIANKHVQTDKTIAIMDTQTQTFKACVSTVGAIRRLPGSLIKPLLVYAPALEENFLSPATPILDEKIDYGGYAPNNFDGLFHGYVSVREALSKSLNVPAVKTLEGIGVKTGVAYLEKLGLSVEKDDLSLALALGGMKNGFCFNDLISAYSAFSNGGEYVKGSFIAEIKIDGACVYKRKISPVRVFSEETAYLTTDMLKTAAKTGTAKKLRNLPFEIAAKTGTAGTENGNTDAYALSYTTRDCVGVWLGSAAGGFIDYTGGGLPCNLLLDINERLYQSYQKKNEKIENFAIPQGVVRVELDKISYYDTHTLVLADDISPNEYRFKELFSKRALPTKKSDFFSNPTIIPPSLKYENGNVIISFDKSLSKLYDYKIERYDYVTHNTLYFGEYTPIFCDESVEKDKRYLYTVTPYYKDRKGKSVVLPEVNTKNGEELSAADKEILEKNWWDE